MTCELRRIFEGRPEYQLFDRPRPGEDVWPHQGCPRFRPRRVSFPPDPGRECWFCVFANFHLSDEEALEIGVCQFQEEGSSSQGGVAGW